MSTSAEQVILALSDNSAAGRVVVNRAVRLAEVLHLPVDIHYLLHIPNGQGHLTSEVINESLDELIEAEKVLSSVLHEQTETVPAHASVEPDLLWEGTGEKEYYITFLTHELLDKMKVRGMQYLTFPDSPRKVDISRIVLLCESNSNREYLGRIAELMRLTEARVNFVIEEGMAELDMLNEIFGSGLNSQPIETHRTERQLKKILGKLAPELICMPSTLNNQEKIAWLRQIRPTDILIY